MSRKPLTTWGLSPVKGSTINLAATSRNPILGTDNWVLPEYSQRAKRLRSSINYDDLAAGGKLT